MKHNIATMQTKKTPFLVSCLMLVYGICFGQYTEVINSNRPGLSHSAFSIGTDVLQFEAGPYLVEEIHTPLQYEVTGFGAHFVARYGLFFEELELNVEGVYQNDTFSDFRSTIVQETDRSNFKNVVVSAKYMVYDPFKYAEEDKPNLYSWKANHSFKWKSLIPAIAVSAGINIDTKDNPYTGPGIEGISPKVMIATQNNFAGGWVFVMNFIKDRLGTDYSDFHYILTLTKSIGQRWAVFGETHGISSDFYADNLIRFGGGYLMSKDFQLDASITVNSKDTPSVFNLNLGASYRFDWHSDKEIDNNNSVID